MPSTSSAGDGVRLPRALISRLEPTPTGRKIAAGGLLLLAASIACGVIDPAAPATLPLPSPTPGLATPSSMEPAAGICGEAEGSVVTIALHPDVPDPRCAVVRPEQVLEILNDRDASRQVSLGPFQFEVPAGSNYRLDQAFGSYLAPGVHLVQVQPCCGPELWLKAQ